MDEYLAILKELGRSSRDFRHALSAMALVLSWRLVEKPRGLKRIYLGFASPKTPNNIHRSTTFSLILGFL